MKKITFLLLITFFVIINVSIAGCIGEKEVEEKEDSYGSKFAPFNSSAYVLTDVVSDTDDKTMVSRTYTFKYNGVTYTVNLNVPQYRLNNYRANTYDLYDYHKGFSKDVYLEDVVAQLKSQMKTNDRQEFAEVLISFVQKSVKYEYDINVYGEEEYWAYPIEALMYGLGDCDCKATLMTAVLRTAGFDALTLLETQHIATIVSDIEPYACDPLNIRFIPYDSKQYYLLDAVGSLGVGYYPSDRFNNLSDFYTIYTDSQWSTYINNAYVEGGLYIVVLDD